ncbi:hypothetical protein [Piscirickettsia litoralis]|uniref:Uncharacterized protein n=1 Tax=Piscirickettsia litoralis TaxID=1891921 RepID=A0ABX3A475_9GAMM|nr:hypothetical protein [Piscirickettsia litoralis]ODN42456.1 hypothetical protein BGC07_05310 [Piscirickettsia litoralis]
MPGTFETQLIKNSITQINSMVRYHYSKKDPSESKAEALRKYFSKIEITKSNGLMSSTFCKIGSNTELQFDPEKGIVDFIRLLQDVIKDLNKAGRMKSSLAERIEKEVLSLVYDGLNKIAEEQEIAKQKLSQQVLKLQETVKSGEFNYSQLEEKFSKLNSEFEKLKLRNQHLLEITKQSVNTTHTITNTVTFKTALERTAHISNGLTQVGEVMINLQNLAQPVSVAMQAANVGLSDLKSSVQQSKLTIEETNKQKIKEVNEQIDLATKDITRELKDNNKSLASFAISTIENKLTSLEGKYNNQRKLGMGRRVKLPIVKAKILGINEIKSKLSKGNITGAVALEEISKLLNDSSDGFMRAYNDGVKFKEHFDEVRVTLQAAKENLSPENDQLVSTISNKMESIQREVESLVEENEKHVKSMTESVVKSSEEISSKLKVATEKA